VAFARAAAGRPVIVRVDPHYLDPSRHPANGARRHFGDYRVLVTAVDGSWARVSDISSAEPVEIPLEQLRAARLARDGFSSFWPRGRWLDLRFPTGELPWKKAIVSAAQQAARRMLQARGDCGIAGLDRAAQGIADWLASYPEPSQGAYMSTQEAFDLIAHRMEEGATRSCYRALYAEFLKEGGRLLGDNLLVELADAFELEVVPRWQNVIRILRAWAGAERAPYDLSSLGDELLEIARTEQRLCGVLVSWALEERDDDTWYGR
jgi:hypothetical protein